MKTRKIKFELQTPVLLYDKSTIDRAIELLTEALEEIEETRETDCMIHLCIAEARTEAVKDILKIMGREPKHEKEKWEE